jgi:HNH endonuclease
MKRYNNFQIDRARLREALDYDPKTGGFTWAAPTNRRIRVGRPAGTVMRCGFVKIRIDGRDYYGHRLAWIYIHRDLPAAGDIFHRDGNRQNNSIANLRPASRSHKRARAAS